MAIFKKLKERREARKLPQLGKPILTVTEATGEVDISVSAKEPFKTIPETKIVFRGGRATPTAPPPTPKPTPIPVKIPKPIPRVKRLSTVEAVRRERGIRGALQRAKEESSILSTAHRRAERRNDTYGFSAEAFQRRGRIATLKLREKALEVALIPLSLINLAKDPKQLKEIPKRIREAPERFGKILQVDPTTAFVSIGADIFLAKGFGASLRVVGKVGRRATTRLSPKFRGVKKNVINIPSRQTGKAINIKIGGPVKKLAEPLKEQVKLAGKRVTGVSAQADKLVNLIRTKRIVRKPIPQEAGLSTKTKNLLRKFDERRIGKRDLIELDNRIRIETKGAGSLLERSFFADPRGRLRPSRLGVKQKEASLLDLLAGDVTFKTQSPQVLVFQDIKVQKLPKSLSDVQKKLRAGKTLTESQSKRLLKFQLKVSGKFKPIGSLTREPEITLAPSEIIKREKTLAVTIINGKRVPIVRARIVKAKPETKRLLQKAKQGKLKSNELKKLKSNLKKETGFKPSFSRGKIGKPRARIPIRPRKPIRPVRPVRPRKPIRPVRPRKPIKKRPVRRKPIKPRIRKPVRPIPVRRPAKRPPARPPARPPLKPPIKPPAVPPAIIRRKRKVKIKKKKEVVGFNVFGRPLKKRKGEKIPKLIKLNKKPLTKTQAKRLGSTIVDKTLSRTFKIQPTKLKPKKPVQKTKPFQKKKFRTYRIKKGKRIPLKNTFIEKRGKYLIDSVGEKRGLTIRRELMLRNLKRARAVRMKNIARSRPQQRSRRTTQRRTTQSKQRTTQSRQKRSPSQAQLNNLARGREIRRQNLKKRK